MEAASAFQSVRLVAKAAEIEEGACFTEDTEVVMSDGSTRKIEDVQTGDWVMTRSDQTGLTSRGQITQTFSKSSSELVEVRFTDGTRLTCTQSHPFFVPGKGWVAAGELKVGDATASNGGTSTVLRVRLQSGTRKVCNLEVANTHTYFVTSDGDIAHAKWVHNDCSANVQKTIRSLETQIEKHEKKLADYLRNPDAYDNQGRLAAAKSQAERIRIIEGRVNHLKKEIAEWKKQILAAKSK